MMQIPDAAVQAAYKACEDNTHLSVRERLRLALTAALPYLTNEGTEPVDVAAVLEAISSINIHDEANGYEWRGDGDYTPNEQEKALLEDFGCGLISQIEDAIRALSAEPAQGEQWFETHGRLPLLEEAQQAARVLNACNGFDLSIWSDGIWPCDDLDEGLKALLNHSTQTPEAEA